MKHNLGTVAIVGAQRARRPRGDHHLGITRSSRRPYRASGLAGPFSGKRDSLHKRYAARVRSSTTGIRWDGFRRLLRQCQRPLAAMGPDGSTLRHGCDRQLLRISASRGRAPSHTRSERAVYRGWRLAHRQSELLDHHPARGAQPLARAFRCRADCCFNIPSGIGGRSGGPDRATGAGGRRSQREAGQPKGVSRAGAAFNVFSHNSRVEPSDGLNGEERKMIDESRKIWNDPHLEIVPTCVRVPVFRVHTRSR